VHKVYRKFQNVWNPNPHIFLIQALRSAINYSLNNNILFTIALWSDNIILIFCAGYNNIVAKYTISLLERSEIIYNPKWV